MFNILFCSYHCHIFFINSDIISWKFHASLFLLVISHLNDQQNQSFRMLSLFSYLESDI